MYISATMRIALKAKRGKKEAWGLDYAIVINTQHLDHVSPSSTRSLLLI